MSYRPEVINDDTRIALTVSFSATDAPAPRLFKIADELEGVPISELTDGEFTVIAQFIYKAGGKPESPKREWFATLDDLFEEASNPILLTGRESYRGHNEKTVE